MVGQNPDQENRVLVSQSPEALEKLADLVVAKLVAKNDRPCFPSKTSRVRIPSPAPSGVIGGLASRNSLSTNISRYELYAQAKGLSPNTIIHVKRCIGFFAEFPDGINDISTITGDDLRRFIVALKAKTVWENSPKSNGKRLSPVTVNTYVRAIKSFWGWLNEEGIIRKNPLASVKTPKKAETIPAVFTEAELKAVLKAVSTLPRERAIVELFLGSGIRLEELSSLKVPDVDLINCRLKVFGKGGKERLAYFSRLTADSLSSYLKEARPQPLEEDYLFLTQR